MPKKIVILFILIIGFGLFFSKFFNLLTTVEIYAQEDYTLTVSTRFVLADTTTLTEIEGVPITSNTGHEGVTEYIISGIPDGTEASLTAPDTFVHQGIVYYFDGWRGSGCRSFYNPTINVSITTDRNCYVRYIDAKRWHCYAEEYFGPCYNSWGSCGLGSRLYEDQTGNYDGICFGCQCHEEELGAYTKLVWGDSMPEKSDKYTFADESCVETIERNESLNEQCPAEKWEHCDLKDMIWTCYDCGITCNLDYPEVCCNNPALSNPDESSSCISAHDCYTCKDCIPPKVLNVSSGSGGSVTYPGEGTFTYFIDTGVDLLASASSGHRFVNWTGDTDTIADVNDSTTTITMNDNYDIAAVFVEEYALTISSTDGGSVIDPGEGDPVGTYLPDETVDLVTVADSGHRFVNWTGDIGTIADVNDSTTIITMEADYNITANFERLIYIISASAGEGGSIDPSDEVSVDHGDDREFIIIADLGYEIKDVLVDGETEGPVATYTFENVIANHTIHAEFERDGPNDPILEEPTWRHCTNEGSFRNLSIPVFEWAYDPDAELQESSRIQIEGALELLDEPVEGTYNIYIPHPDWSTEEIRNNLLWGNTYTWRVQVIDINDNESGWSEDSFIMPDHAHPWIEFSWDEPIIPEVPVEFRDESICYDQNIEGGNCNHASYSWTFPGIYDCVSPEENCETTQNPVIKFLERPATDSVVTLRVTDGSGKFCLGTKGIEVKMSLPKWRDVAPI